MLSQILFYGAVIIACLILGNEMLEGVRKSVKQMETSIVLVKGKDRVENIR